MHFEAASEAPSPASMNAYVSENCVFLFCERMVLAEKNVPMLRRIIYVAGHIPRELAFHPLPERNQVDS